MQGKYFEWSYQMPSSQYSSRRLSEKCVRCTGCVCVYVHVTSAINHKPQCPCSSNTYHGNQCRGQVEQSYPTPENTTSANKYGRLIYTSTTRLSRPIDLPRIMCVHTSECIHEQKHKCHRVCRFFMQTFESGLTWWHCENCRSMSARRASANNSSDVLNFCHCQQILWKVQNQQWIDPKSNYCLWG